MIAVGMHVCEHELLMREEDSVQLNLFQKSIFNDTSSRLEQISN
jgi:hypothetical protein